MSKAWRDTTGGICDDDLETARLEWLARSADPVLVGRHDFSIWPRDVLAYHIRRKQDELPWLASGTRV